MPTRKRLPTRKPEAKPDAKTAADAKPKKPKKAAAEAKTAADAKAAKPADAKPAKPAADGEAGRTCAKAKKQTDRFAAAIRRAAAMRSRRCQRHGEASDRLTKPRSGDIRTMSPLRGLPVVCHSFRGLTPTAK